MGGGSGRLPDPEGLLTSSNKGWQALSTWVWVGLGPVAAQGRWGGVVKTGIQGPDVGEAWRTARAMGSYSVKINFLVDRSGDSGKAAVGRQRPPKEQRQEVFWGPSLPPSSV